MIFQFQCQHHWTLSLTKLQSLSYSGHTWSLWPLSHASWGWKQGCPQLKPTSRKAIWTTLKPSPSDVAKVLRAPSTAGRSGRGKRWNLQQPVRKWLPASRPGRWPSCCWRNILTISLVGITSWYLHRWWHLHGRGINRVGVFGIFHKWCTDYEKHRPIHIVKICYSKWKNNSKNGRLLKWALWKFF